MRSEMVMLSEDAGCEKDIELVGREFYRHGENNLV